MFLNASLPPFVCSLYADTCNILADRIGHAFIELHDYVGAKIVLNLYRLLRRKEMSGAIVMRLKLNAVITDG